MRTFPHPVAVWPVMVALLLTGTGCQPGIDRSAYSGIYKGDKKVDAGETVTSSIGGTCQDDADCASGTCNTGLPGGYCTQACSRSNPCPDGAQCLPSSSGGSRCAAGCASADDCRDEYTCLEGVCLPRCTTDDDCSAGRRCDARTGQCVTPTGCRSNADCPANQTCNVNTRQCVPASTSTGRIGAACTQDSQCTEGGSNAGCITEDSGFDDGYCTALCGSASCPNGNACVTFQTSQGDLDLCMDVCTSNSDCRAQYNCLPLQTGQRICFPWCTSDSECNSGDACNPRNGLCEPRSTGGPDGGMGGTDGGTPGNVTITRTVLGTVNGGANTNVNVDIPANAVSSFLVATPTSGQPPSGTYIGLAYLQDPNRKVLYDAYSQSSFPFAAYPNDNGAAGILFPNAPPPVLDYIAGRYTSRFYSYQSSVSLQITHILKTATGPLTGGTVDLNLWFNNSVMTAAQAKSGTNFQAMLNSIRNIWGAIGIRVGNVNYFDMSDPNRTYRYLTDAELGGACRSTGSAPNDGLNLMFIDSITSTSGGGGGTILGIAAGIPGTPMKGTAASCVAVAMNDWQGSTTVTRFATTIVHEAGHWQGLFHTTEADGRSFDPLPDTSQCPVGTYDRNRDGYVDDTECSTRDGRNVMFWLSDSTGSNPHTTFTGNQQFVLLRNPTVY